MGCMGYNREAPKWPQGPCQRHESDAGMYRMGKKRRIGEYLNDGLKPVNCVLAKGSGLHKGVMNKVNVAPEELDVQKAMGPEAQRQASAFLGGKADGGE